MSYKLNHDLGVNNYKINNPTKNILKKVFRKLSYLILNQFILLINIVKLKNFLIYIRYRFKYYDKLIKRTDYSFIVIEDLELLPFFFYKFKNTKIIFDAREYYPSQNEESIIFRLFEKPQRNFVCKTYLNKCFSVITVSPSIAKEYDKNFNINTKVIRSIPNYFDLRVNKTDPKTIRIVHHGMANKNRKIENMINLMEYLDERFSLDLYLKGDQVYINSLKKLAKDKKTTIKNPVAYDQIIPMLNKYDVGLFYVEPTTFNLKKCLPNKLFEFIQARLAVAIGPSTDMLNLIEEYNCGIYSDDFNLKNLAKKINELSSEDIDSLKENSHLASKELCWENEKDKIMKIMGLS